MCSMCVGWLWNEEEKWGFFAEEYWFYANLCGDTGNGVTFAFLGSARIDGNVRSTGEKMQEEGKKGKKNDENKNYKGWNSERLCLAHLPPT